MGFANINSWVFLRLMFLYFTYFHFSTIYIISNGFYFYCLLFLVGKANYGVVIVALIEIILFILHIFFVLNEVKLYYAKKE